jgi:hypothetical protein
LDASAKTAEKGGMMQELWRLETIILCVDNFGRYYLQIKDDDGCRRYPVYTKELVELCNVLNDEFPE